MLKPLLFGIAIGLFLFFADWIGQNHLGQIAGAVIFFALIPLFVWEVVDAVRKWLR